MKNLMYKVLFVFAFSLFSVGLAAQGKAPQKAKKDKTTTSVDRPGAKKDETEATTTMGDARAERAKLNQTARAERATDKADRKARKQQAKAEAEAEGQAEKSKPEKAAKKRKAKKEKKANGWRSADHPGKGKAVGRG